MAAYKGWFIYYRSVGALHWKAARFGVSLTAASKNALKSMIDQREIDEAAHRTDRYCLHCGNNTMACGHLGGIET